MSCLLIGAVLGHLGYNNFHPHNKNFHPLILSTALSDRICVIFIRYFLPVTFFPTIYRGGGGGVEFTSYVIYTDHLGSGMFYNCIASYILFVYRLIVTL